MNADHPLDLLRSDLHGHADPAVAQSSSRFMKTGPGEYGEGDRFIGVRVPLLRSLAKEHHDLPLDDTLTLLRSKIHEERLLALLLLVRKFQKAASQQQTEIYGLYLANTEYINGWDLVDTSAPHIVGSYLWDKDRSILTTLANSDSLWERRIAMLATFFFIRKNDTEDAFRIAELLVNDPEDLIHKAVGWMLREAGKRHPVAQEVFLHTHYKTMPRTMLRYAIEKFPARRRNAYLTGKV